IDDCDIVVMSDYAKGFVSPSCAQRIIRRSHEVGRQVIVDPRPQHRECYIGCDYLTPNWKESRALLGLPDAEHTPAAASEVAAARASCRASRWRGWRRLCAQKGSASSRSTAASTSCTTAICTSSTRRGSAARC